MHPVLLPRAALDTGTVSAAPVIHLAETYRRRVDASLARIWENVFDWAHLHDGSFADYVLLDRGAWEWPVEQMAQGGKPQQIERRADHAGGRYTSTTIAGPGTGAEIRVALQSTSAGQVVSGACAAHPELELAAAPAIRVDGGRIIAGRTG